MSDLPGNACAGQLPLRIEAVFSRGVDDGNGPGRPRCGVVVIRHEHVDPTAHGQVYLWGAAGAAIRGHDQRPALDRGALYGAEREAVPVTQPFRHVRIDIHAERSQRQHQDGQPGQAVRIEIAVHENALAPGSRLRHPPESGRGVGKQPRVMQPLLGRGYKALQVRGGGDPARGQKRQEP